VTRQRVRGLSLNHCASDFGENLCWEEIKEGSEIRAKEEREKERRERNLRKRKGKDRDGTVSVL